MGPVEGKPSFRFGLSTVRFGLISVAVIALGAALLTWVPNKTYQPITHPVGAIVDSVTKEPSKAEESGAASVVREGLEAVGSGIVNVASNQPISSGSVALVPQTPAFAPKALAPAPEAPVLASGAAPTSAPPAEDAPASYEEAAPALAATPDPQAPAYFGEAPTTSEEPAPSDSPPGPDGGAPLPAATPNLPAPAYYGEAPTTSEEPPTDPGTSPTNPPSDPRTSPPPHYRVEGCEPPDCTISVDPGTTPGPAPSDSPSGPDGSTPK